MQSLNFLYKDSSLVESSHLMEMGTTLTSYINHLSSVIKKANYEDAESSINLPSDPTLLENVLAMKAKKSTSSLKYIIDIGIGGSNLGTKAVYDALVGFYDHLQPERFPKIIFLDTVDETMMKKLVNFLKTISDKNELIINAISKSGGTTETIVNLETVLVVLNNQFGEISDRVVITTDEGSKLWSLANEHKVDVLTLPKQVGGRFSVLSSVGLFPLACCGFDIQKLLNGAVNMRDICVNSNIEANPAALSAIITYNHSKNGKNIHDSFFFSPRLESMGKWYRQLMGESLGKEHNLDGAVVHAGITPTVSIGSTDLHSVGQLYLGGPRDKITTFIYLQGGTSEVMIPSHLKYPLVEGIAGKSFSDIMSAICQGVKVAYKKQGLPYMELVFSSMDEYSLGEFLQLKMLEMMYLGHLLHVNTFDQPHVELYKTETKRILGS